MSAPLYGVKNDRATIATVCEPWLFQPNTPNFAKKEDYLAWRASDQTEHLLYCGGEGVNPALRVNSKTNPVQRLTAVIVDYDSQITDPMVEAGLENVPADFKPNWISTTFSGGRRLIYLFEQPIPFAQEIAKSFYRVVGEALLLQKLLPGLDPKWAEAGRIFDVGTRWIKLSDEPIPTNVLHHWLFDASKRTSFKTDIEIPLSDVAAEIEKQFPGAVDGELRVGMRLPVFWDSGSNPSSVIVQENGCICFSRDKLFYTWADILGASFVAKYQADRIGGAISNIYWDSKMYYQKTGGRWRNISKEDLVIALKVESGLDAGKGKHETASEVEKALHFIQKNRRVDGVVPRLFDPSDLIYTNGETLLNISHVRPIQPHDVAVKWGEGFPWHAEFFDTCFDPHPVACVVPGVPPQPAKDVFLAWWKRFYLSALQGDLLKGHACFLVGGVNRGKTLLSNKIVGASVGGFGDASDHVTKGSEFNRNLMHVALWAIDDGQVASDPAAHRKFGELTKRLCANPTMQIRAMYRDPQTAEWFGRLLVTLNDDIHSMQMLPDLSSSMDEKVIILRFADGGREFPPKQVLEATIAAELPYLLRYLVDMEVASEIVGDSRFGIRAFVDERLRTQALHSSGVGDLLEIIDIAIARTPQENLGDVWFEGTATEFLSKLSSDETLRNLVGKFSPKVIGKRFSEASRIKDSGITVVDSNSRRGNRYRVAFDRVDEPRKIVKFAAEAAA